MDSTSSAATAISCRAGPNEAIPRAAKRERSAIVAMGVVSRSGLKRFFIGNTAEFVMDAIAADILVVKPPDFDSRVPRIGTRRSDSVDAHPAGLSDAPDARLPARVAANRRGGGQVATARCSKMSSSARIPASLPRSSTTGTRRTPPLRMRSERFVDAWNVPRR